MPENSTPDLTDGFFAKVLYAYPGRIDPTMYEALVEVKPRENTVKLLAYRGTDNYRLKTQGLRKLSQLTQVREEDVRSTPQPIMQSRNEEGPNTWPKLISHLGWIALERLNADA